MNPAATSDSPEMPDRPAREDMFANPSMIDICANFVRSVAYKAVDEITAAHAASSPTTFKNPTTTPVVIIGLNGIQGSGKSTLARKLKDALIPPLTRNEPGQHVRRPSAAYNSRIIRSFTALSLDDFYMPHSELAAISARSGSAPGTADGHSTGIATTHRVNPLLQCRGQPGTHDMPLLLSVLRQLKDLETPKHRGEKSRKIVVPRYDKSAHSGQGDRLPREQWDEIEFEIDSRPDDKVEYRNDWPYDGTAQAHGIPLRPDVGTPGTAHSSPAQELSVHVVMLEGWCLGFAPVGADGVRRRWDTAKAAYDAGGRPESEAGTCPTPWFERCAPEDMVEIDRHLSEGGYTEISRMLDAFVHLDAERTEYVYHWRLQQEAALRESSGRGMTDEQVVDFVDRYYPSYEIYLPRLRQGRLNDGRDDGENDSGATHPQVRPRLHFTLGRCREMLLTRTDEVTTWR